MKPLVGCEWKWLLSFGGTLLIGVLLHLAASELTGAQPERAESPAPVAVAPVIQRELAAGQTFVASVGPLKRAMIGSAVEGRMMELLVEEGQRVLAGQPLAQLLTTTIELELKVAEAELVFRQAELDELRSGPRLDELEQAKAKMLGAKSNLEFAKRGFGRIEELFRSSAVSKGDYDEALSRLSTAEQSFAELQAAHALLVAGTRPERLAQAEARLANQLASVDLIRDRIKKYTIVSNFDGYVVAKFSESGAWLRSGDPVFEVLALDEVEVRAFVTEEQVPFVKIGMPVRVEVPSVKNRVFTGAVSAIVPQGDTRARTFPVNIRVKNEIFNEGPILKSGMYARVELPTGEPIHSLMVPKDAIVLGGVSPIVFVIRSGEGASATKSKVASVTVELGVAAGEWIAVKGALDEGDQVVVEGNERLRPDQAVTVKTTRSPPKDSEP
jgi:RND family efflux transporter MFP subunit